MIIKKLELIFNNESYPTVFELNKDNVKHIFLKEEYNIIQIEYGELKEYQIKTIPFSSLKSIKGYLKED